MNTKYERGTKLLIELTGGEIYEGFFESGNDSRITLSNVSEYPAGIRYKHQFHFYKMEIVSETILEENNQKIDETKPEETTSVLLISDTEYENLKEMSREKTKYISVVDNRFVSAIQTLKSATQIAVFGFGSEYGRNSRISILVIATVEQIYIFDIKLSGVRAFEMGLKDILESRNVLKIMHDSKTIADCLLHAHKVSVEHVFDTQVADLLLRRKKDEDLPSKVRKFPDCIKTYMNIPTSTIYSIESRPKQLLERPLSDDIILHASLQTAYLYKLQEILNMKLLNSFYLSVDCYMKSMRDEQHFNAGNMINDDVPKVLLELNPKL